MDVQVREHLRLLSIFHYVVGGIGCLVSLIPCIHLAIGIFFLAAPEELFAPPAAPGGPAVEAAEGTPPAAGATATDQVFPKRFFGLMFTVIPALIILVGLALSSCIIAAGRRLAALRSYNFCLVVAGIECLFMPFGTVLGVFTILTLVKPEARTLFGMSVSGEDSTGERAE